MKKMTLSAITAAVITIIVIAAIAPPSSPLSHKAYAAATVVPTIKWTGKGDGTSWSDPANWDINRVPTGTDKIFIGDNSRIIRVHLDTDFTLQASGMLIMDYFEELIIDSGRVLNNDGGSIYLIDFSYITNNAGTTINNYGTIYLDAVNPGISDLIPPSYGGVIQGVGGITTTMVP